MAVPVPRHRHPISRSAEAAQRELLLDEFDELLLEELLDEFEELLLDEFDEELLELLLDEFEEELLEELEEELEAKRSRPCCGAAASAATGAAAPVTGIRASAAPTTARAAPAAVIVTSIFMSYSSVSCNVAPAMRAGIWENGCAGMFHPRRVVTAV
ncbi:MAG: hypothetical protein MUC89_06235 [Acetobacteraceae bacterium]|jgi:hypothetical protein|nr:hypothetical protein [Acetobacteraceae bacterium]